MTGTTTRPPLRRALPRFARVLAVAGLCFVVLPATGFWVETNDAGRGISALRMRINHSAGTPQALWEHRARHPEPAARFVQPLSLDHARYRATLRDLPKAAPEDDAALDGAPGSKSLITLLDNQVALALADNIRLPIRGIGSPRPSQTYRFWTKSGTFVPADGHPRTADPEGAVWLTDPDWKMGGECVTRAETGLAQDIRRLALALQTPWTSVPHPKSRQYMNLISQAGKRFGLSPQLIYAIMRTESAFNPFAVSNAGAMGLMQLVPGTAGNEVHTYLTGKAGRPTTKMLFNPESNIEYGSAYLHLLGTRYFSAVADRASRELCMIAAYNAGPRAVLKVFSATPEAAINAINAQTPDQLFKTLSLQMPAEETRQYIGKVLANINSYPG